MANEEKILLDLKEFASGSIEEIEEIDDPEEIQPWGKIEILTRDRKTI